MIATTRAQREALYQLFCRTYPEGGTLDIKLRRRLYRALRGHFRTVPSFGSQYLGGYNVLLAEPFRIYYGIEADGHIHT